MLRHANPTNQGAFLSSVRLSSLLGGPILCMVIPFAALLNSFGEGCRQNESPHTIRLVAILRLVPLYIRRLDASYHGHSRCPSQLGGSIGCTCLPIQYIIWMFKRLSCRSRPGRYTSGCSFFQSQHLQRPFQLMRTRQASCSLFAVRSVTPTPPLNYQNPSISSLTNQG